MMRLEGKKITVVGFGRTGAAAAGFLAGRGAVVTVYDDKEKWELDGRIKNCRSGAERFFFRGDYDKAVEGAELVVLSPGVPPSSPIVRAAGEKKINIISEVELFCLSCKSEIIAVTGTNGKTTTAELISRLLNNIGHKTVAAGNTGIPLTGLAPEYCGRGNPVVCEISSFQLERTFSLRPRVSVVLNVTPDHMDRYSSFEEYARVKRRILLKQGREDFAVLNADDETAGGFSKHTRARVIRLSRRRRFNPGVYAGGGHITGELDGRTLKLPLAETGINNQYNSMAAVALGLIYKAGEEALVGTFRGFGGIEHRREFVAEVNGIGFINDSKATNPEAAADILKDLPPPLVFICGGRDKGLDFSRLRIPEAGKIQLMVLVGESRKKLKACFGRLLPCVEAENFHRAVRLAYAGASPGGTVVLSPGCASFDMFSNFEERGAIFKAEVFNLRKEVRISSRCL